MGDDRGRREGGAESPAIAEIDGEQHEVAAILGAVQDVHGKLASRSRRGAPTPRRTSARRRRPRGATPTRRCPRRPPRARPRSPRRRSWRRCAKPRMKQPSCAPSSSRTAAPAADDVASGAERACDARRARGGLQQPRLLAGAAAVAAHASPRVAVCRPRTGSAGRTRCLRRRAAAFRSRTARTLRGGRSSARPADFSSRPPRPPRPAHAPKVGRVGSEGCRPKSRGRQNRLASCQKVATDPVSACLSVFKAASGKGAAFYLFRRGGSLPLL